MENWQVDFSLVVSEGSVEKITETAVIEATKNYSERRNIEIADETVDKEINFSDLGKVEEVIIISDNPITIKIDTNTATGILGKFFYLSGTSVESLFVSNDSGEDAKVKFILGG